MEKKSLSRRNFLKAAGVVGGMAMASKSITSLAAVSFEENPLVGCIDMHVHAGPDNIRRALNDIQLVQKAKEAGMRAVVMHNHQFPAVPRAYIARQVVPGIEVFGGIALNYPTGGINPASVEMMLAFTGDCMRFVKMPTQSTAEGAKIWDGSKKVLPDVIKILKMIAKADIAMFTGHISSEERLAVVKAAKEEGVRKMVITHAMSDEKMTMDIAKQVVEMGAFIEHCYLNIYSKSVAAEKTAMTQKFVNVIKETGAERNIISTDLGQYNNQVPTEGLKDFIFTLMKQGITRAQIDLMVKKNPAKLLGLDPWA
jgi:imidazolonepropionase-like amidohydrolase